jgi:hypothetical protein
MKFISIIACLVLTLIFSPNLTANVLVELDQFPDWFKDSMAREQKVKKSTRVKIEKFNVDQKVKGKVKLIEEADGTWYYNIDIGTASPVECYVLTTFDGTATSFYSIMEHSLKGVETINKKSLSAKFNYAIDSGVMGSTPYLLLDILYNLGDGDAKVAGVLKGISVQTDQTLQICMHNEIGYRQTFFDTVESFIEAIVANEKSPEFFEPIYQFTLNGMPIGYGREKYTTDADGDINIQRDSAFIIPVDASSIARSDSVAVEWSNPDGSLINADINTIENGVLTSQFAISLENGKWLVEGQLQGKPIKSVLEYDGWLISSFGSSLETASLRKSEQQSAEFNIWIPEADPTSAMKLVISKISDNSDANLKLDMGPITMKFLADNKGIFQQGTMDQGGMKMRIKLLSVIGEPLLP